MRAFAWVQLLSAVLLAAAPRLARATEESGIIEEMRAGAIGNVNEEFEKNMERVRARMKAVEAAAPKSVPGNVKASALGAPGSVAPTGPVAAHAQPTPVVPPYVPSTNDGDESAAHNDITASDYGELGISPTGEDMAPPSFGPSDPWLQKMSLDAWNRSRTVCDWSKFPNCGPSVKASTKPTGYCYRYVKMALKQAGCLRLEGTGAGLARGAYKDFASEMNAGDWNHYDNANISQARPGDVLIWLPPGSSGNSSDNGRSIGPAGHAEFVSSPDQNGNSSLISDFVRPMRGFKSGYTLQIWRRNKPCS